MTDEIDEKDFLARWSARKRGEVVTEEGGAGVAIPEAGDVTTAEADEAITAEAPPVELPDIETLQADSDFTAFLADNVPKDLAKRAFRKLWQSDPVLANIDGLNDYDDDYAVVGKAAEVITSAYQAGKGYAGEDEEDEEEPEENGLVNMPEGEPGEDGAGESKEHPVPAEDSSLTGTIADVEDVNVVPPPPPPKPKLR